MTFVESVCKFNEIAGTPNEFNERKAALYIGLIMEELAETVDALPEREAFSVMKNFLNQWSLRFKKESNSAMLRYWRKHSGNRWQHW